jgi:hypothetical protein
MLIWIWSWIYYGFCGVFTDNKCCEYEQPPKPNLLNAEWLDRCVYLETRYNHDCENE